MNTNLVSFKSNTFYIDLFQLCDAGGCEPECSLTVMYSTQEGTADSDDFTPGDDYVTLTGETKVVREISINDDKVRHLCLIQIYLWYLRNELQSYKLGKKRK